MFDIRQISLRLLRGERVIETLAHRANESMKGRKLENGGCPLLLIE